MPHKLVAFAGFALAALAFVAVMRHLPDYQRLQAQVRPVTIAERSAMIVTFWRARPVPAHLKPYAPALAQLYWSQRYTALSCTALLILITSSTLGGGESGWIAVLGVAMALLGLVLSAAQTFAGWRYLRNPLR